MVEKIKKPYLCSVMKTVKNSVVLLNKTKRVLFAFVVFFSLFSFSAKSDFTVQVKANTTKQFATLKTKKHKTKISFSHANFLLENVEHNLTHKASQEPKLMAYDQQIEIKRKFYLTTFYFIKAKPKYLSQKTIRQNTNYDFIFLS
jgi:hypothetical protein